MLRHLIIAALRNLAANRLISAIAILGLSVGIAAALLMAAVIRNQLSFDHFVPNHERTYIAVTRDNPRFVKPSLCSAVPYCQRGNPRLAAKLKLAAPEIEAVTRLAYTEGANGDEPLTLQSGAVTGQEMLYWADPNAFDVLPLPVLQGNLATALAHPDGIVLPRAMARKYFGRDDVVGRSITLEGHPMIVRAVIRDLPANGTSLESGIFASALSAYAPPPAPRMNPSNALTFVQLKPGASIAALEHRLPEMMRKFVPASDNNSGAAMSLVPLDQFPLHEGLHPGAKTRLMVAGLAGLILFLLAVQFPGHTGVRVRGSSWTILDVIVVISLVGGTVVLWFQYAQRRTIAARCALGAMISILVLAMALLVGIAGNAYSQTIFAPAIRIAFDGTLGAFQSHPIAGLEDALAARQKPVLALRYE